MATKQERCSRRIEKIREKMAQKGMDALMLFSPINMFYYSGYYPHRPIYPTDVFRLFPLIIPRTGEPFHIMARNVERMIKEDSWIPKQLVYDEFLIKNAEEFIAEVFRNEGLASGKIGIEEDVLVLFTLENLKRLMPGITLAPASNMLLQARDIKDEDEIRLIQGAIDVTIIGYETAFREIKPGRTERASRRCVNTRCARRGPSGSSRKHRSSRGNGRNSSGQGLRTTSSNRAI